MLLPPFFAPSLLSSSLSILAESTQQQCSSSSKWLSRLVVEHPEQRASLLSYLSCAWLKNLTGTNRWVPQLRRFCRFSTTFWRCTLDCHTYTHHLIVFCPSFGPSIDLQSAPATPILWYLGQAIAAALLSSKAHIPPVVWGVQPRIFARLAMELVVVE